MSSQLNCTNRTQEEWVACLREFFYDVLTPNEVTAFTVAYSIVTAMGIIGNGLVIFVVLRRREMRTNRNVFIVNLALANFLLAVIWIPFLWMPSYQLEFNHSAFFCKLAQSFPGINIYCSTLTISIIAIDRYFVISRAQISPDRLKIVEAVFISICIWVVAFALSLPYLLFFDIEEMVIPEEISMTFGFGRTVLYKMCAFDPQPCQVYKEDMAKYASNASDDELQFEDLHKQCIGKFDFVVNILLATFLYVIPLGVLFTFNFLLTAFLRRSERQTSAMRHRTLMQLNSNPRNDSRDRRNRTTALLFAMAFTYAILWLPFTIVTLYWHLVPGQKDEREMKRSDEACKLISMLSICVNPFLYGYLNTNFNREFKIIFTKAFPFMSKNVVGRERSLLRPSMTAHTSGFTLITRDSDSASCHITRSFLVRINSEKNGATPL